MSEQGREKQRNGSMIWQNAVRGPEREEDERQREREELAMLRSRVAELEKERREDSSLNSEQTPGKRTRGSKSGASTSRKSKSVTAKNIFALLPYELLEIIIQDAVKGAPNQSLSAMRAATKALTAVIDRINTTIVLGGPTMTKAAVEKEIKAADDDDDDNDEEEEEEEGDYAEDEDEDEEEGDEVQNIEVRKKIYHLWIKLVEKSAEGISTLCVSYNNKRISWLQFKNFFNHKKCKDKLIASVVEINIRGLPNTVRIEDLSPFSGLTRLSVAGCKRLGSDLSFASLFPSLTHLDISGCNRINSLIQLSSITTLESLCAGNRSVTNLTGLSLCTRLRSLDMTGCLKLVDLTALSTLVSLESLKLSSSFSRCWGQINVSPLKFLSNLTSLDFSGNRRNIFNENVQTFLSGLVNLQNFNLCGCNRLWILSPFSACVNLVTLDLSRTYSRHNQQQVTTIAPLAQCLKLESLTLNKSALRNLSDLALCPRIKVISMPSLDKLSDISGLLASAGSLEVLDLGLCKAVSTDSLNTVLEGASRLVTLNLSGCVNVSRISLHRRTAMTLVSLSVPRSVLLLDFLSDLAALKTLELRNKSIKNLDMIKQCTNLERLDLTDCVRVSDLTVLPNLSLLAHLNLSANPIQNDEISALGACTSLTTLILKSCSEVSQIDFVSSLVKLQELSLHSLTLVQDQYLVALSSLRKLVTLDLRGCLNIRDLGPLMPLARTIKKIKMDKGVPAEVKESGGRLIAKVVASQ